jgi:prepilin-type N-terminal cleavage/methylation domain-containing protein/prepilin-type processing-associated H-X9-DG protein
MTTQARRALTIIELLVVLAIVGVMLAMLVPAVQAARESARRTSCLNNLKQIGTALQSYHSHARSFPPGYRTLVNSSDSDDEGPGWGWAAFILQHVEESNVAQLVKLDEPIESPANEPARMVSIATYTCPSDSQLHSVVEIPSIANDTVICQAAAASYVGSVGTVRQTCKVCRDRFDGVFGRNSRTSLSNITDGVTKTMLVGERQHGLSTPVWAGVVTRSMIVDRLKAGKVAAGPAYVLGTTFLHGDEEELEERSRETVAEIFGSDHPGVMNFAFCDGSVRPVAVGIDDKTFMALSTARGQRAGEGIVHYSPFE